MPIKSLNPYINFNGTARQAIALYERVFGARTVHVVRAGDIPDTKVPADQKDHILHGVLTLGAGQLMVSDVTSNAPASGNVQVSVDFTDIKEMMRTFAALAEGGTVNVPLQDTFWGAKFGMLTDPFGVRWMFNCAV